MTVSTVPPEHSFFDVIVARWMSSPTPSHSQDDGVIIVPNRRSCLQLSEAFLRYSDGAALLLPRIVSYADLDAAFDGLLDTSSSADAARLTSALSQPTACDPMQRMVALTLLVLRSGNAFAVRPGLDQAWKLAKALADLLDDAARVDCDLAARLPEAAEGQYAAHWERSLQFLHIVTKAWPDFLADNGVVDPVARLSTLIRAQIQEWQQHPSKRRIWAVGFTDVLTAVGAFLQAVAALPNGCVVLPGLDLTLDDALWAGLPESHPQFGLKQILCALDRSRREISVWTSDAPSLVPVGRVSLLRSVMMPASGVAQWINDRAPVSLEGLSRLVCEDPQQESRAIAMVIRHEIAQPGCRVALITPDRQIARRVSAQLLRYGIVADDSAGEALSRTPAAVFLRLLAQAQVSGFSPVSLLALLKHPLAAAGLTPGACRASTRKLERIVLRGPAPPSGFEGMRKRCQQDVFPEAELADRPDIPLDPSNFLTHLEALFEPLQALTHATIPVMLTQLLQTAEHLATTPDETGAARLWGGEDGHALSEHFTALLAHTDLLGMQDIKALPAFLTASMASKAVMGQRVLRGREGGHLHPRVFIMGLLEARLQRFDLIVVAGLEEGVWPPVSEPGPWLSRPMRERIGLQSPDDVIGTYAFDFVSASLSAPRVVLSNVARREGAPAVPSRWMIRLDAYLGGRRQTLPIHPASVWQAQLDQPVGGAVPAKQPMPRPPVTLRPRRLSVTEVDTWLADPYAIYARHILQLRPLDPIDAAIGRAGIGTIIHEALAQWIAAPNRDLASLITCLHTHLANAPLSPATKAWWRGRMTQLAQNAMHFQSERSDQKCQSAVEIAGKLRFDAPAGQFELTARADRIDLHVDGRVSIIDYKSGRVPKRKDTDRGWASQLWLEAAIVAAGGFPNIAAQEIMRLEYWRLSGQRSTDKIVTVADGQSQQILPEVAERLERFKARVALYDRLETPYIAQPRARYAPPFDHYGQLARVREWRLAEEEEDG